MTVYLVVFKCGGRETVISVHASNDTALTAADKWETQERQNRNAAGAKYEVEEWEVEA